MDATTGRLVRHALDTRFEDLSQATVDARKLRLLDALACVAGAQKHPVSRAAHDLALSRLRP